MRLKAIFVAPCWGALAVTAFLSWSAWTDRPAESYYFPVLFELMFAAAGYVVFGVANLVVGVPTAR